MKINIVAIGQRLDNWVTQGFKEYQTRMPDNCSLNLIESPLLKRSKSSNLDAIKQQETEALLSAVPANNRVIALNVCGKALNSQQVAIKLQSYYEDNQDISLLVGGPDGLAEQCIHAADWQWSLSPLTLPHPLVRIVLAEQLYRAWTINIGHPYHR